MPLSRRHTHTEPAPLSSFLLLPTLARNCQNSALTLPAHYRKFNFFGRRPNGDFGPSFLHLRPSLWLATGRQRATETHPICAPARVEEMGRNMNSKLGAITKQQQSLGGNKNIVVTFRRTRRHLAARGRNILALFLSLAAGAAYSLVRPIPPRGLFSSVRPIL